MENIMQAAARGRYWEISILYWSRTTNCFNMAWPIHSSKSLPNPATGLLIIGSQAPQQQKTAHSYNTHQVV